MKIRFWYCSIELVRRSLIYYIIFEMIEHEWKKLRNVFITFVGCLTIKSQHINKLEFIEKNSMNISHDLTEGLFF
jgi:hypothetical protein